MHDVHRDDGDHLTWNKAFPWVVVLAILAVVAVVGLVITDKVTIGVETGPLKIGPAPHESPSPLPPDAQ